MVRAGAKWQLVAAVTVAACLGGAALVNAQFTSFSDHKRSLLEGNWQSCREGDGQYSERVYDGKWPGLGPFELHLGPFHEFAFFRGIQEEHRDHSSSDYLLKPYNLEIRANSADRTGTSSLRRNRPAGAPGAVPVWFFSLTGPDLSSH
jgi:hypothetical protein